MRVELDRRMNVAPGLVTLPCDVPHPQVTHKLQLITQGKWVDERPLGARSPSPEPVYNETGARINTREQRAKDALSRQRNVSTELEDA